jgi:metal transporter CNNM
VVGVLLVKELLQHWGANSQPLVKEVLLRPLLRVPAELPLYDVLNIFQTGRSHMALVVRGLLGGQFSAGLHLIATWQKLLPSPAAIGRAAIPLPPCIPAETPFLRPPATPCLALLSAAKACSRPI